MGTGAVTLHSKAPELVEASSSWGRILAKVQKEIQRFKERRLVFIFGRPLAPGRAAVPRIRIPGTAAMKRRYDASPASRMADEFVLYRIIGNDLVPRHAKGQSYRNVEFILEHEPVFPDCEKRWIVNRIADPVEEAEIISLLERRRQPYLRIPFDDAEYGRIEWDSNGLPAPDFVFSRPFSRLPAATKQRVQLHLRRLKNLYVMNNNGARNAALQDGRNRAKWVLPFDGNCYFTAQAFQTLREQIVSRPWYPYFIVPMARITDNSRLLEPDFVADAAEEPQIVFRSDTNELFDERIPYGRRPKVDLLWRLVVPGPWDRFVFDVWDHMRPAPSVDAGQFLQAGWVARLDSGRSVLEVGSKSYVERGTQRGAAIIATLDMLDGRLLARRLDPSALVFYDPLKIEGLLADKPDIAAELRRRADVALARGPYSVVDKSSLPPSGDLHDYWHPAPYWWPDPSSPDGLPYVWRDGQRRPGTALYDEGSDQYDRTRLQNMIDDTTVLALAGAALRNDTYLRHAAGLVRTWFLDPATRMNPHLSFAQVRRGHGGDIGQGVGIIEFKDLYFFLDAVRLLARSSALSTEEVASFRRWLTDYANWLVTSEAGQRECLADNNHGTFYDVQVGAIAAYLGDAELAAGVRNRARLRILGQFAPDGSQPHELGRTKPRHYALFGLAGWTTLARILAAFGEDLWRFEAGGNVPMARAFEWLARADDEGLWPRAEIDEFLPSRLAPLWADYRAHFADVGPPPAAGDLQAVYHPDFGIAPFWMLVRNRSSWR